MGSRKKNVKRILGNNELKRYRRIRKEKKQDSIKFNLFQFQ